MVKPKDYSEFQSTLEQSIPPESWSIELKALWYDAKGDWVTAHDYVDSRDNQMSKWVHAYLHRKEGDEWNAGYWYRQAKKPFCQLSLNDEHKLLVSEFL